MRPSCLLLLATACGGPSLVPCDPNCPDVSGDYGVVSSSLNSEGGCAVENLGFTLRFVQNARSNDIELQPTLDADTTLLGHLFVPQSSGDLIAAMESHTGEPDTNIDLQANFLQGGLVQGSVMVTGLSSACGSTFSFTAQK